MKKQHAVCRRPRGYRLAKRKSRSRNCAMDAEAWYHRSPQL